MPNNNATDPLKQPLMSTGTTEPGFGRKSIKTKSASKPIIGDAVVGELQLAEDQA